MPGGKEGIVFVAALERMVPFGEAIIIAVMGTVEPGATEGQERREELMQKCLIANAPVEPPCQRGQKRRGQKAATLPSQAGATIHKTVCLLDGQEVMQNPLDEMRGAGQEIEKIIGFQGRLTAPQTGVITAITLGRVAMVHATREDEGRAWQGVVFMEKQTQGNLLTQRQGGVPIRVTGADVHRLTGIEQLDPGARRVPGLGCSVARRFKGGLWVGKSRLRPGQLPAAGGVKAQVKGERRIGAGAVRRPPRQEENRSQIRRVPTQNVYGLDFVRCEAVSFQRDEQAAHIQAYLARARGVVNNGQPTGHGVRIGHPIFRSDIEGGERRKIQDKEIRVETAQSRRSGKRGRIGDRLSVFAEAGKDAHGTRPQAIGGVQRKRCRFTFSQLQFPDMVVGVIRCAQARVRCQGEGERVARAQRPVAHSVPIVRGVRRKVKGFVLE
ncbi:MAG: hypothetical protein D6770_04190 [Anaerolineae bacterium]|nr:MAG: hypothetical protein D6770_04190 [Anaerolineae bacterium]